MLAWVILVIAGLFEVAWAYLMKQSEGFTKPAETVGFFITLALSMFLLSQALKSLPVGTAYAIWTGIGAVGTAVLGVVFLGESRDIIKLASMVLIVAGIIGLGISANTEAFK